MVLDGSVEGRQRICTSRLLLLHLTDCGLCGLVLLGVFALLQAYAFLQYLKDRLTRQEFQTLFFLGVSLAAGLVFLTVIYLTYTGTSTLTRSVSVLFGRVLEIQLTLFIFQCNQPESEKNCQSVAVMEYCQ